MLSFIGKEDTLNVHLTKLIWIHYFRRLKEFNAIYGSVECRLKELVRSAVVIVIMRRK